VKQNSKVNRIVAQAMRNPMKALFIGLIRFYQRVISPGIPGRCKYYPSCSQYALDAVQEYGAFRGLVLGAWRVVRCNPLSYGGYDPVSRQRIFRQRHVGGDMQQGVVGHHATDCCAGHHGSVRG
jgi:uncharacterized protein